MKELKHEYFNSHEEADSKMIYIASRLDPISNVVIRTNDTDVLIISLGNFHNFSTNAKLWLDVGICSNNTRRYIDVRKIYGELGETLCRALPALHAITGCDYTASFHRKGKIKPLKIMEKDTKLQEVVGSLGYDAAIPDEAMEKIEA